MKFDIKAQIFYPSLFGLLVAFNAVIVFNVYKMGVWIILIIFQYVINILLNFLFVDIL